MNTTTTEVSTYELEVGHDVRVGKDEETGEPISWREWFVTARRVGSNRYWYDYSHFADFRSEEEAEALARHIRAKWGAAIPASFFDGNLKWTQNTSPDPMDSLRPWGEEWQREQDERQYGEW